MEDVEDVADEAKVTIHLPEPGPIGRPIVQVRAFGSISRRTAWCARGNQPPSLMKVASKNGGNLVGRVAFQS